MTITYPVKHGIYVNMTNRCPCACTFCLRQNGPGVYGSDPLWLEHEPTVQEVCDSIDTWDLSQYEEIVFCGYGEPTERLEDLLEVARYIKSKSNIPLRINTNGLADLIWQKDTAPMLKSLIDAVSISLNAMDAEEYLRLTRSKFGIGSYDAMLRFTKECTKYVPHVMMTVVGEPVTTPEEQETCRKICESVGATLRVRPYES
jgi:radical SAM enzyme (TIGR04100 family)